MKKGDVIIFPTDTVYGLGCRLYDEKALKKIFEIKHRDPERHIPVLVENIVSINPIATYDYKTLQVMTAFWPGPLTIILNTKKEFEEITGEKTIAIRIPDHYLAIELINQFGPLRTTSVNISGEEPLNTLEDVKAAFGDQVSHVYGEFTADYIGVPSTIIDVTGDEIKVVREGAITLEEIKEVYKG